MNGYQKLMRRHQKEFNEFPIHFAFGQEQIDRKIEELHLSKDPGKRAQQIVSIGAGGFVLKEDFPRYAEMCERHAKERLEAMADDENGATYLYDMFYTELVNHEYGYTLSTEDTLCALGLSREDIESNPVMKEALRKATTDILKAEGYETEAEED